jgi:hypothetical protein
MRPCSQRSNDTIDHRFAGRRQPRRAALVRRAPTGRCGVRFRTGPEPDSGPGRPGDGLTLKCAVRTDRLRDQPMGPHPATDTETDTSLMFAPDRTPVPGRAPAPRRVAPDAPTQKISPATGATAGMAATAGSAATTTVSGQDGGGRFGLSVVQIVASTAAAVTAALLGSRLGVAGTLTGAALASIVSAVGAAVYGHSLLATRRQVTKALRLVRPAGGTPARPATGAAGPWTSHPTLPGPDDDPTMVIPQAGLPVMPTPRRSRRPLIVVLAAAAAAAVVFAASLATVTLLETVKGGPLSGGTGLSIRGGNNPPGPQPTSDPTTVTVTSTTTPTSRTSATTTATQTLTRSPTTTTTPTTSPTTSPTTAVPTSGARSSAASAPPSTRASAAGPSAGQSAATTAPTAP